MDTISAWLRGIILVLLFSIFADLLLPGQKFSKVVKLAMGLIIILAMLTPVFQLLGKQLTIGDWLDAGETSGSMPMGKIQEQAETLKQRALNQTEQEWKGQLQTYMAKYVESLFPVTVSNIDVKLQAAGNRQPATAGTAGFQIQSLQLYVAKRSPAKSAAGPSNIQGNENGANLSAGEGTAARTIQPVQPVRIDGTKDAGLSGPSTAAGQPELDKLSRDIRSQLATTFEVAPTAIQIIWDKGG